MSQPLFLGFGGNINSPQEKITIAISKLAEKLESRPLISSFYETKALTLNSRVAPNYVNCVAKFASDREPEEILKICLALEKTLGRDREKETRWGDRTIDIDILAYGDLVIDSQTLSIPHPRMHERDFVLVPLAEIAPDFLHPILKKPVIQIIQDFKDECFVIQKIDSPILNPATTERVPPTKLKST